MNEHKLYTIICFFLIFFNAHMIGQEDTMTIEVSTEPVVNSDFNNKREYKYIDEKSVKEKTLIKLGFSPFVTLLGVTDNLKELDFNCALIIEKKVNPSLSLIINNNLHYKDDKVHYKGGFDELYSNLLYSISFGGRFYYSLNKKIKKGLGQNNFHNNYFSLELDECIKYEDAISSTAGTLYGNDNVPNEEWSYEPFIKISWGVQRRIKKWGFVDGGPYVRFKSDDWGFGLNFLFGLGLGL